MGVRKGATRPPILKVGIMGAIAPIWHSHLENILLAPFKLVQTFVRAVEYFFTPSKYKIVRNIGLAALNTGNLIYDVRFTPISSFIGIIASPLNAYKYWCSWVKIQRKRYQQRQLGAHSLTLRFKAKFPIFSAIVSAILIAGSVFALIATFPLWGVVVEMTQTILGFSASVALGYGLALSVEGAIAVIGALLAVDLLAAVVISAYRWRNPEPVTKVMEITDITNGDTKPLTISKKTEVVSNPTFTPGNLNQVLPMLSKESGESALKPVDPSVSKPVTVRLKDDESDTSSELDHSGCLAGITLFFRAWGAAQSAHGEVFNPWIHG